MKIDINEIMSIIPHRYPFLLIDRVTSITLNESIVGIKNVTINEPQFTGHFPERPVILTEFRIGVGEENRDFPAVLRKLMIHVIRSDNRFNIQCLRLDTNKGASDLWRYFKG